MGQVIIAETGADMSRFPTPPIWLPGPIWRRQCTIRRQTEPGAGKRHGNKWLAAMLVNDEAHTRRLVAQLERLGHTVIINPAA